DRLGHRGCLAGPYLGIDARGGAEGRDGAGDGKEGDVPHGSPFRGPMPESQPSPVLRVDRLANLVERLAVLVHSIGKPSLSLADVTHLCHPIALVAGEQRVRVGKLGTSAVAVDAIDDLRNLAHHVEHLGGLLLSAQGRRGDDACRRDTGAWSRVNATSRRGEERVWGQQRAGGNTRKRGKEATAGEMISHANRLSAVVCSRRKPPRWQCRRRNRGRKPWSGRCEVRCMSASRKHRVLLLTIE